jgi:hypothetical protein
MIARAEKMLQKSKPLSREDMGKEEGEIMF